MIKRIIALNLFFVASVFAQTIATTTPTFPTQTDQITIEFDITNATHANRISGYAGNVYAHTGIYIDNDKSSWKKVIGSWGNNTIQPQLTYVSFNKYKIVINNPRTYYGVTDPSQRITHLNFVLRSSDGTKQTEDIILPLYSLGIGVVVKTPTVDLSFGDPMRSPVFTSAGETVPISVTTSEIGTTAKSINLYINGIQKAQSLTNTLNFNFVANDYSSGRNDVKVVATDIANSKDSTVFVIFKNSAAKNLPIPSGSKIGINYDTRVLALYAPSKKFVYLIGDHSDWKVDAAYLMNRDNSTPDSLWWISMPSSSANPPGEIAYQFLIDGSLRIYDPYTDKILDPWNDSFISPSVYPNLKSYPTGKTSDIVSVLQPSRPTYNWKVTNFGRPGKEKLVIYEMLVRDFVSTHSYKTLIDTISYLKKLGVNAIGLMPISEFEGNDSWGYNPMTYFAPDKYYGTSEDLKNFIDICHQNGIAVIQDLVLNHAYNLNSMAKMYWDNTNNRPAANNPWFNISSPNKVYYWGNDFNHESNATKYFVDRVTSYWLTEYKIDGFRFDFTKGFTNTPGDGSSYDANRIAILKRIADKIWETSPDAYVILEHFAPNSEETELSDYGMLIWGNLNTAYNQATMGYATNPSWDFSKISSSNRGWSQLGLVGYMESHDEERLMFKNLTYGNFSGSYSTKQLNTALSRIKLAAAFFIPIPGPKMIWQFGELGYDVSIDFNGRTGAKPIRWNYYSEPDRKNLFNTFAALNRLKRFYPAFSSTNYTLNASGAIKILYINHPSMNVAAIGNFDVVSQAGTVIFQKTGKWYEFFTGDSLTIPYADVLMGLLPGEYRLYTSVRIPKASEILTSIRTDEDIPSEFRLEQNYPNPFNPETVISYQIPVSSMVSLKIYDLLGREVATLVNEFQQAGIHHSQFSTLNSKLSSGVYFYRIEAGSFVQSKKMLLIK